MVQSSIYENPSDLIYFSGFASVMLTKVSTTHYFGQRVITRSEEVAEALYEVPWDEQDSFRRRNLVLLMAYNYVPMSINVMGFYYLDLETLGKVEVEVLKRLKLINFFTFRSLKRLIRSTQC